MSKSQMFLGRVPTTAGVIVAASSATRTVDQFSVLNSSSTDAVLNVWCVPSGGTRQDGNKIIHNRTILANTSDLLLSSRINACIPRDATIHAQSSVADALTLEIGGRSQ